MTDPLKPRYHDEQGIRMFCIVSGGLVLALLAGAAMFIAVAALIRQEIVIAVPDAAVLLGIGLGAASLVAAVITRQLLLSKAIDHFSRQAGADRSTGTSAASKLRESQSGFQELHREFFQSFFIPVAIAEGGLFFNAIFYLMTGHFLSLLAAGILMGLMVAMIPTPGRVKSWLESGSPGGRRM